jgi:anti-sigma factor ChrR (cupin superfamily)
LVLAEPRRMLRTVRPTATGRLPADDHHGGEEIVYVLEGTFVDQYRSSGVGTIIRGEAGSSHRPGTPDGVTFMVVRSLAEGEAARIAGVSLR